VIHGSLLPGRVPNIIGSRGRGIWGDDPPARYQKQERNLAAGNMRDHERVPADISITRPSSPDSLIKKAAASGPYHAFPIAGYPYIRFLVSGGTPDRKRDIFSSQYNSDTYENSSTALYSLTNSDDNISFYGRLYIRNH
jgi:hypothetical protein